MKIVYRNDTVSFSQVRKVSPLNQVQPPFILYPNPMNDQLNLNFESRVSQNLSIYIFTAQGKEITSATVAVSTGHNTIPLTINGIEAGIYLVKIIDGSGSTITKKVYKK